MRAVTSLRWRRPRCSSWAKAKLSIMVNDSAGHEAMQRAGIEIPGLQARDGLATINGSNVLTAMSALHIYDMERFLKQAEIAAAMSIEALLGNMKPYNTKLHELRGFKGAITSAKNIMKMIKAPISQRAR